MELVSQKTAREARQQQQVQAQRTKELEAQVGPWIHHSLALSGLPHTNVPSYITALLSQAYPIQISRLGMRLCASL